MITIVGATHPGVRSHNEDCFVADAEQGIGLIADGMGGYACGEIASELVKQTVVEALHNNEGLKDAITRAHRVVKAAANSDAEKRGMGSTVIALKLRESDYEIAWVGDSRAYLWDGTLRQISRDHSYVENLIVAGVITEEEAVNHPNRNLVTQAVGVAGAEGLDVSFIQGRLAANQQLLLCSDGLVDEVIDKDIAQLLQRATSPQHAVDALIKAALDAGGHDNITVVIAAVGDGGQPAKIPDVMRTTQLDVTDLHVTDLHDTGSAVGRVMPDSTSISTPTHATDDINRGGAVSSQTRSAVSGYRWFNHQIVFVSIIALLLVTGLLLYFA